MSDISLKHSENERSVSSEEEISSEDNKAMGSINSASNEDDTESYKNYSDLQIMKNGEAITLDKLPKMGGQPVLAYSDVKMPAKLYTTTDNIERFVESQLNDKDEWNLTKAWNNYLEHTSCADITKDTLRETVQKQLRNSWQLSLATVNQIFADYDKHKKKTDDPLSDKDRAFLHLLVGPEEFGIAVTHDTASYLRESRSYYECIRLIKKFCGLNVDTSRMERNIDPRPKKRFCDIVIFISHFFGRAEHVWEVKKVRTLWDTLVFVDEFVYGLEEQSILFEGKTKTEKSTKSTKAGEQSMDEGEREIEQKDGKSSFETTNDSNEVQVPEDVGTKTRKRKGAENKTPVAKKKEKPESVGEDQIQQMAKDKKMTESAVSVVSRQCILVSHHIVLKPY